MEGAILLGLILLVGGAVLERFSVGHREPDHGGEAGGFLPLRIFGPEGRFTKTSRLLQALGTVLTVIGVLALFIS